MKTDVFNILVFLIPKKCPAKPGSSGVQDFVRKHTFVYGNVTTLCGHDIFRFQGGAKSKEIFLRAATNGANMEDF